MNPCLEREKGRRAKGEKGETAQARTQQDRGRGRGVSQTMWAELQAPTEATGSSCGFSVGLLVACLRPPDPPTLPPSAPKDARFERLACLCRPFSSNPSTCHPVEFPACDPSDVWPDAVFTPGRTPALTVLPRGRSRHSFTVVWRFIHPSLFFPLFPPSRMQGARIRAVLCL